MQEGEVARGLREGKPDAWRALYDAYAGRVWRTVARLLGPESADVADVLAAAELATLVRATLTELPVEYEILLTARYLDGITVDDIATQEQSTAVAVRSKLARARQALRQLLLRHSVFADARGPA